MNRLAPAVCVIALAACGDHAARPAPANERARDSVIGGSRLPGAQGVRSALRISDSAAARRGREDSIATAREP